MKTAQIILTEEEWEKILDGARPEYCRNCAFKDAPEGFPTCENCVDGNNALIHTQRRTKDVNTRNA